MKKKHVALALAAAMAVTTVGGATVYASEEHGPSSEAAPAGENYDARIAEIRTETDLVKREALMHEAEDELMNTWAIIPPYYYNDVYMQKTDVENIYCNLFGFKYSPYNLYETAATLNDTWGFKYYDHNWKTPEQILANKQKLNGMGVNYLLNVGPDALGRIPSYSVDILRRVRELETQLLR